jgi:short-subunit dehydrogenase involved in D-alanine esterification of teichoic acids
MDSQLTVNKALITGSIAGIGSAIVDRFFQEGTEVVINWGTEERIQEAKERL